MSRRFITIARSGAALLGVFAAFAIVSSTGCGDTSGTHAHFTMEFVADAGEATFTTSTGWQVELTSACAHIGPVYLFGKETAPQASLLDRAASLLEGRAFAHVGDELGGAPVRGEWLSRESVRIVPAQTKRSPVLDGHGGELAWLTYELARPRTETNADACLHGAAAYVVGEAVKGTERIAFEGALTPDASDHGHFVQKLPLEGALADGAIVRLAIRPSAWFDGAHFDRLPAAPAGERRVLDPTSQPHSAWLTAIRAGQGITPELRPATQP